jgi:hypothetical protein
VVLAPEPRVLSAVLVLVLMLGQEMVVGPAQQLMRRGRVWELVPEQGPV